MAVRYSNAELEEFKVIILQKIKEAETDLGTFKREITLKNNDFCKDDTDIVNILTRQEKYIINLKNALIRIENKTYGICRATGKLISKERLTQVPHATLIL